MLDYLAGNVELSLDVEVSRDIQFFVAQTYVVQCTFAYGIENFDDEWVRLSLVGPIEFFPEEFDLFDATSHINCRRAVFHLVQRLEFILVGIHIDSGRYDALRFHLRHDEPILNRLGEPQMEFVQSQSLFGGPVKVKSVENSQPPTFPPKVIPSFETLFRAAKYTESLTGSFRGIVGTSRSPGSRYRAHRGGCQLACFCPALAWDPGRVSPRLHRRPFY